MPYRFIVTAGDCTPDYNEIRHPIVTKSGTRL